MSSEPEPIDENATSDAAPDARDLQDMVISLNFVPTWARVPSTQNPYGNAPGASARERRGDSSGPRRDSRQGPPSRGQGGGQGRGSRPDRSIRAPMPRREQERERPRPEPRLPIEISFIPERTRLGAVVKQLHSSMRAYPLLYVAGLFLNHSEHHLVKIEYHGSSDPHADGRLFQCDACKAVFIDKDMLKSHALEKHLGDFFEIQDIQVEPPAGNFVCVARCRLSGELLGPPNYHGYNEKLQEMRRERFPQMSIDEYRKQVEMVHDAAVIEKWKDGMKSQRVYKLKGENAPPEPMKKSEAEAYLQDSHFPKLVRAGNRFVVPAVALLNTEDSRLSVLLNEAWARESRFPLRLSLALRPAFRRMRLNLFKAGRGETFVTAIPPRPMDGEHAVEPIKQIIKLLHEFPGSTRQQVIDKLCPGAAPDSPEVGKMLSPFRWLIEKGHVIEFFNGTLSVPGNSQRGSGSTHAGDASTKTSATPPAPSGRP